MFVSETKRTHRREQWTVDERRNGCFLWNFSFNLKKNAMLEESSNRIRRFDACKWREWLRAMWNIAVLIATPNDNIFQLPAKSRRLFACLSDSRLNIQWTILANNFVFVMTWRFLWLPRGLNERPRRENEISQKSQICWQLSPTASITFHVAVHKSNAIPTYSSMNCIHSPKWAACHRE